MQKLNLTYVKRTERTSKSGKPFTSLSIRCTQHGEKFLSGFGNAQNASWKEGDEVEVAEVKEVVKEGKTYLNFEMPKSGANNSQLSTDISEILTKLGKMDHHLKELAEYLKVNLPAKKVVDPSYPGMEGEPNFDDMPINF